MIIGANVPFLIRRRPGEDRLVGPAILGGVLSDALIWNCTLKQYVKGSLHLQSFRFVSLIFIKLYQYSRSTVESYIRLSEYYPVTQVPTYLIRRASIATSAGSTSIQAKAAPAHLYSLDLEPGTEAEGPL